MRFTREQKAIFKFVEFGSGNGIIDAVAGAGKTTTIMEAAQFIKDKKDVLFCAFNRSIAKEIKRKFIENGINDVKVKTIHALGYEILKAHNKSKNPLRIAEHKYRMLLKNPQVDQAMRESIDDILRINNLDPNLRFDDREKFAINNLIYNIKQHLFSMNHKYRSTLTKDNFYDFEKMVIHFGIFNRTEIEKAHFDRELRYYYECHKILLKAGNKIAKEKQMYDFTDMLYLPYVWKLSPLRKFKFLFIDECQDLSKGQFAIAAKYGKRGGRILAVGDPSQSIYGFTGADIESFNIVKEYTKAKELPLTTCFRCPRSVIEIAQAIRPDIHGNKRAVGKIHRITFDDIIKKARPNDLIISRIKAPLLILVFQFIDKNIKVKIHDEEVKETVNELKYIFKEEELNADFALEINGFKSIKRKVIERWEWVIKKKSKRIVDKEERDTFIKTEIEYLHNRLTFLQKKHELWKKQCRNISEMLEHIQNFISSDDNPIRLSSIHRAKGLEENRVFIIDYDNLPMRRKEQQEWELIQELNLKYVAITRAKRELFLVEPIKREEKEE